MPPLCRLNEIEEVGARGFSFGEGTDRRDLFVVRIRDEVFAYVDSCPHVGTPLEMLPDRFLTRDRRQILCSTHGARFEIASGRCVAGPCTGQSLQRLSVHVENGVIVLEDTL